MKKKYNFINKPAIFTLAALLTVGSVSYEILSSEINNTINLEVEINENSNETDVEVIDTTWEESTSAKISFNNGKINISGEGASVKDNVVTITNAGTYVISGNSSNSQIIIDANKDDEVRLILNGITLSNETNSPLFSKKAGKTILILQDNTNNIISDSQDYIYSSEDDEPDAALFSKNDLYIAGTGNLTINGNYKNGIRTNDNLIIQNGNITVNAENDAIKGKDGVIITNGNFIINSKKDGIKSNNEKEDKGFITIEEGNFKITSENDAVQAESNLTINGGTFEILTGEGIEALEIRSETDKKISNSNKSEESMKGLKAGKVIIINDGLFKINSQDDAIHSNGNVLINGGTFEILTDDDAVHADENLTINDGFINILASYEGLESATIDINGGEIIVVSSDDGINASDGTGSDKNMFGRGNKGNFEKNEDFMNLRNEDNQNISMENSRKNNFEGNKDDFSMEDFLTEEFEKNNFGGKDKMKQIPDLENMENGSENFSGKFEKANDNLYIRVTGGTITITSEGDGFDSNGNLFLEGGNIFVSASNMGTMEGALDADGTIEIVGCTIAATGGNSIAYNPNSETSQSSIIVYFNETQNADTNILLKDENDKTLISYTPKKQYKSVALSSPEYEIGKTYTLYVSDEKLCDIKLTEKQITVSEDGSKVEKNKRMAER